jgi:adenylate cyclase
MQEQELLSLDGRFRTLANWLWRRLRAVLDYGTQSNSKSVTRRLRLLNVLSLAALIASILFAIRYALIDWRQLYPLSVWATTNGALWGITPLFNRYGNVVAAIYFGYTGIVGLTIFSYLSGSSAGVHYFLLVGPAMVLFIGSRNIGASLGIACTAIAAFLMVQFGFPLESHISPLPQWAAAINQPMSVAGTMLLVYGAILYSAKLGDDAETELEHAHELSENLLLNLMPPSIAARLKERPDEIIADHFDGVTILFADIVNFTPRASRLSPTEIVGFLNRIFSEFDKLAEKHKLEKIKTIGDAYMVAGGMPDLRTGHAHAVADMALNMLEVTNRLSKEVGEKIEVRIGIHIGPAVAGVIGTRKMFYDVWGDTVNTASRMESHGIAGKIQVTEAAKNALSDHYEFQSRGSIDVKGKGEMELFYLVGRIGNTAVSQ